MEKDIEIEVENEKEDEEMGEWEIKNAAETILEAEKIKKDPKKWPKVKAYLNNQKETISSLAELRDIANGNKELPSKRKMKLEE